MDYWNNWMLVIYGQNSLISNCVYPVWECGCGCFSLKMYQNNIFLFFKNYFWNQRIKIIEKYQKNINFE